jgi:hypothetical protein
MATNYQDRLRIPLEGNGDTRFETSTGLHVATGYTRVATSFGTTFKSPTKKNTG